jgi:cleavage and polyadenylation specificity factor subunit 2
MARIAATEEAEGIRDEEDVGSADEENPLVSANSEPPEDSPNVPQESQPEPSPYPQPHSSKSKFVATPQEVHDSFNAVNTLRYSQPAHLSGKDDDVVQTVGSTGHPS